MAGYRQDYSMSNNAYYAYQDGEMPLSKWTKEAILEVIKTIASEDCVEIDFDKLKKLTKKQLMRCLTCTSWHHTSSYYNKTSFYGINIDLLDDCFKPVEKMVKPKKPAAEKKLGTLYHFEWSGTRRHPRATECREENIYIETKGCFYLCFKNATDEKPFFKKKIGSNGTRIEFLEGVATSTEGVI